MSKTYFNLARKDMDTFMSQTYQVHMLHPKGEGPIRERYHTKEPFKHHGRIVTSDETKRVGRHKATKAVILYHYITINEIRKPFELEGETYPGFSYKNFWRRCLLLDGPNKGRVVSV